MTADHPSSPYGYAIFCDDLRAEMGGKFSLMGIYRDSLLVPRGNLPVTLPKFCIFVCYVEPRETALRRKGNMQIMVYLPDNPETPAFTGEVPFEQFAAQVHTNQAPQIGDPDVAMQARLDMPIVFQPFVISSFGLIKVRALLEGKILRMGALRIEAQDAVEA